MDIDEKTNKHKGQFITRKAHAYTPIQRALVVLAGVITACIIAGIVTFCFVWSAGKLASDPDTATTRNLIYAQKQYAESVTAAKRAGASSATYTPSIEAKARVILAQMKVPGLTENATAAADSLMAGGTSDPLALYAASRVYASDAERKAQSFSLLEQAAQSVGDNAGELTRVIYSEYSRALTKQGNKLRAASFLDKAAVVAPANPSLFVELGELEETQSNWVEAGKAYYRALEYNPNFEPAKLHVASLVQTHSHQAATAKKAVLAEFSSKKVDAVIKEGN
ncbi:MAG: hypothetical protein JJE36_04920 [Coriobacteriia bacterium]|nr:hypothetical protein [Coriobacteriia bacterium]